MTMLAWLVRAIRRNGGVILYGLILVLSLSLNVVLGLRQKPPAPYRDAGFLPGETLPSLAGRTLENSDEALRFERKTLVYVFSPTCDWCREDYNNLIAVSAAAKDRFPFLAVTADPEPLAVRQYLTTRPFPGPVLILDPAKIDAAIRSNFMVTPQLLVVDRGGLIQRSWSGALFDRRQREVEHFFRIRLPGVDPRKIPADAERFGG